MGSLFGKIFSKLWSKKELKIIIIGLDNSGKTTILSTSAITQTNCISTKSSRPCPVYTLTLSYRLQHGSSPVQKSAVPSLGSRRTELHQVGITSCRQYWEMYYPNTNAILYVVDSHDKTRFSKAGEELAKVLDVLIR